MTDTGEGVCQGGVRVSHPLLAGCPGLAQSQRPLLRVVGSSAAAGKLFVINHVLKDDVMGEMALSLLPGLRSPGRQAGPGQRCYNPGSQENNV